jgi:pimeloyl-ACP methyl ester carboxylesterase
MTTQSTDEKPVVLFVPGGVLPGELVYAPLLSAIGDNIRPIVKELEVYAGDAPPPGYGLATETEAIRRTADAAGAERFHLVGYSAGGAMSLAFTARYPERLKSLALIEPAWIGALTPADAEDWAALGRAMTLPPEERMRAFMLWHMRPGVPPPAMRTPPGAPPPWMAKRPAGLEALSRVFNTEHIDQSRFRLMTGPVYYALGGLSTRFFEREATTLAGLFPDFQLEEYAGRSHFDPPHRAEPERFAQALRALWLRAEAAPAGQP